MTEEHRFESPFDEFLQKATAALGSPSVVGGRDDTEYARVIEERRYAIDLLHRVKMLGFAHSRLNILTRMYRDAEAEIDRTKRVIKGEPLKWEARDEVVWQRDRYALEARVLVAFVYYELTSLAHVERIAAQPFPSRRQALTLCDERRISDPDAAR